ncbi:MAG: flagellar hook basal-body protein [Oscillospiraceae bacterium]|nr:flagellar hook basal-body protein [Oscillospiraceae bacterium]
MNMSFYSAAVGAYQQQLRMNVQANNIANVNTYGFRAEKAAFGELMNRDVVGINNANLPKGTGARMIQATVDFANNRGFIETGRKYDFAIDGDGFFALFDPATGEVSYTRDGAFMMAQFWLEPDAEAIAAAEAAGLEAQPTPVYRLSDNEGRCVLDPQGNFIILQPDNIDAEEEPDFVLGVFDYAVHEGLLHADSSRFIATERSGPLYLGTGEVKNGVLEQSNTDLTLEFIKVIESQRAYGYCLKMVTVSDEIETTFNQLRG